MGFGTSAAFLTDTHAIDVARYVVAMPRLIHRGFTADECRRSRRHGAG